MLEPNVRQRPCSCLDLRSSCFFLKVRMLPSYNSHGHKHVSTTVLRLRICTRAARLCVVSHAYQGYSNLFRKCPFHLAFGTLKQEQRSASVSLLIHRKEIRPRQISFDLPTMSVGLKAWLIRRKLPPSAIMDRCLSRGVWSTTSTLASEPRPPPSTCYVSTLANSPRSQARGLLFPLTLTLRYCPLRSTLTLLGTVTGSFPMRLSPHRTTSPCRACALPFCLAVRRESFVPPRNALEWPADSAMALAARG
mmetsp:Transcript_3668/g.22979  ORF Transcript_3668/g.22979 Transcript_3668/m.22979 type:complete len:250 (-) Transcript_3668:15-764(-)